VRSLIRRDFDVAFDPAGEYRLHTLLTPPHPRRPSRLGGLYGDSVLMQYADQLTVPANHAGCQLSRSLQGFDVAGLPVGIQFVAPDFRRTYLFRVGRV
jgi:aspartyl-tRNA(Asn)/glutamyl-tRNA(Gln) amidotransferase subunit A